MNSDLNHCYLCLPLPSVKRVLVRGRIPSCSPPVNNRNSNEGEYNFAFLGLAPQMLVARASSSRLSVPLSLVSKPHLFWSKVVPKYRIIKDDSVREAVRKFVSL